MANAEQKRYFSQFHESYRTSGLSMLLVDIARWASRDLDMLLIFDGKIMRSYVRKNVFPLMFGRALQICSDVNKIKKLEKEYSDLAKETMDVFANVERKKLINLDDWQNILRLTLKAGKYYSVFDFEYHSEKELQKYSRKVRNNLSGFQKLRNQVRKNLINRYFVTTNCPFSKAVRKIAKRFSLDMNILNFFKAQEVVALFKGKEINNEKMKQRLKAYAIYSQNGKVIYSEGKDAMELAEFLDGNEQKRGMIEGIVAYESRDLLRGKVRILKVRLDSAEKIKQELEKVRQGDIVVSEISAPEILPAIKKATAVVTDLGGLNSHAAIICRELKVPCIVGTRNATKLLHMGDLVEIDTNEKAVKIIKKNR